MRYSKRIHADTNLLVIFDPDQLKHRLHDACDWWGDPEEGIRETNEGNVLFVGLGNETHFEVEIQNGDQPDNEETVTAMLKTTGGRFYIGPAEQITADGCEPEPTSDTEGFFHQLAPGNYQVTVASHAQKIDVWLKLKPKFKKNEFYNSPELHDALQLLKDESAVGNTNLGAVMEQVMDHLIAQEYSATDEGDSDEAVFFHEEYGYLLFCEFDGGIRFYTTVEYDPDKDMNRMSLPEWQEKLTEVISQFNSSATLARAYDDQEQQQIVIDYWYPPVYSQAAFELFIQHWHEDVTGEFEFAEMAAFGNRAVH